MRLLRLHKVNSHKSSGVRWTRSIHGEILNPEESSLIRMCGGSLGEMAVVKSRCRKEVRSASGNCWEQSADEQGVHSTATDVCLLSATLNRTGIDSFDRTCQAYDFDKKYSPAVFKGQLLCCDEVLGWRATPSTRYSLFNVEDLDSCIGVYQCIEKMFSSGNVFTLAHQSVSCSLQKASYPIGGTLSLAGLKKVPSARSEALVVQFFSEHVKVALLPVFQLGVPTTAPITKPKAADKTRSTTIPQPEETTILTTARKRRRSRSQRGWPSASLGRTPDHADVGNQPSPGSSESNTSAGSTLVHNRHGSVNTRPPAYGSGLPGQQQDPLYGYFTAVSGQGFIRVIRSASSSHNQGFIRAIRDASRSIASLH
ncbi:hypothetical protein E1301_Tti015679 [Triplophysa tibetana]|uniref:Uncharacterized protein n=1 Tax=Triplophysa tibetana TaxID=1572043 RepID=A0A5A9MZP1_9TELE|nr:hypothetical protein E1301_Tti015679 [Triplophysa tibetana]